MTKRIRKLVLAVAALAARADDHQRRASTSARTQTAHSSHCTSSTTAPASHLTSYPSRGSASPAPTPPAPKTARGWDSRSCEPSQKRTTAKPPRRTLPTAAPTSGSPCRSHRNLITLVSARAWRGHRSESSRVGTPTDNRNADGAQSARRQRRPPQCRSVRCAERTPVKLSRRHRPGPIRTWCSVAHARGPT